ncbi:serine/threonine protein kinase [Salibacterium aidingense]|uniref:serine/threonine protein kinase n=1 Tax=Salibacterium aidingense TaxID=384933 RepID=UPI0003FEB299|nr:serine/threonine-protein kinase [Salibacterium aidingense]
MNIDGYKVIKKLGSGNFGTTYLVEKKDEKFALKLIRTNMLDQRNNDARRIEREIRTLRQVEGGFVAKYIDDGVFNDGDEEFRYIVMEYANGRNLEEYLTAQGPLSTTVAAKISLSIFNAIDEVHKCGVFHRDLKPGNIILQDENSFNVKIIDFGISKLIDASTLTTTGQGMGTFAYMPPEQLTSARDIDYRADYYSIGAMMYEFLTGERPFKMSNQLDAMNKIMNEKPTPAINRKVNIPTRFSDLIDALLLKEPYQRDIPLEVIQTLLGELIIRKPDKTLEQFYDKTKIEFLPLAQNNDSKLLCQIANSDGLDGAVFNAPHLMSSPRRYHELRENSKSRLIIDPYTHTLAYSAFTTKPTYKQLPYVISKVRKETPNDFRNSAVLYNRAKKAVDFQLNYDPDIIIAPYHFYDSINSDWLIVDHNVFKESRNYLRSMGENRPLYYGVTLDIEKFEDEEDVHRLVNFITSAQPNGFYLQIAGSFDSLNSNHYYIYALLVKMLSYSNKEIILSRINDFSFGLLALGANTIVTSLGQGDNFKEEFLNRESTGGSPRRYYVEGLLGLQNKNVMGDILSTRAGQSLICSCKYCEGSTNLDKLFSFNNVIKHQHTIRGNQLKEFALLSEYERLRLFVKKTEEAKSNAKSVLKEKRIKNFGHKHFDVWKEVILEVADLDFPQSSGI